MKVLDKCCIPVKIANIEGYIYGNFVHCVFKDSVKTDAICAGMAAHSLNILQNYFLALP